MSIENLYPSVKPSLDLNFAAGNFDPRITFSRASGATYCDGKAVAKAEENLLNYSQEFSNATWAKTFTAVVSSATVSPDGTNSASKLVETSDTGAHNVLSTFSAQTSTYCASVYLKASERSFALFSQGTLNAISINLATGAVLSAVGSPSGISSSDAGNGWWRVSFIFSATSGPSNINIYTSSDGVWANRSYAGTPGSGIYIWGAQLEQRSQVTAYTPTTSQPITNYIPVLQTAPANVPRIDYDPITGECKGLLVEEQRTNLLAYSEQFDNSSWMRNGTSVTSNVLVAPDGNIGADKLVEDSLNSSKNITTSALSYSFTSGSLYTLSFFIKKAERQFAQTFFHPSAFGNVYANFDLNLGTVTVASGVVAAIAGVGNGWYRCSISAQAVTTFTARAGFLAIIPVGTSAYSQSYTGDGYSGVYIWGAQLESGFFPTSYIKTEASQVTRAADSASMTGTNFSSWYRQDEGTLFASASSPSGFVPAIVGNSDLSDSFGVRSRLSGVSGISAGVLYGGTEQLNTVNYVFSAENKVALALGNNSAAWTLNAGTVSTDTNCLLPRSAILAKFGASNSGILSGHIKRITYYPKRLSNTELQALTT